MSKAWTADIIVGACGVREKKDYSIVVPPEINNKFLTLLKGIRTEWLMYLTFDRVEEEKNVIFNVDGYVIPDQEANYSNVKVTDPPDGQFGVIHAHQFSESRFFSGTDDTHVNSNNPFSMVINKKGEFLAKVREEVPCGKYVQIPAKVYVTIPEEDETIVQEMQDKIKSTTYKSYGRGPGGGKTGIRSSKDQTWSTGRDRARTRVTERRIKDCPHQEDPSKCLIGSYFDCEYYWKECPKKPGTRVIPEEDPEKKVVQTAIVPVDVKPVDTTQDTEDKKEETPEVEIPPVK